jgi:hypothetical protein
MAGPFDFLFGAGGGSSMQKGQIYSGPQAAESGSIMGFLGSMGGTPTSQDINRHNAGVLDARGVANTQANNEAQAIALQGLARLRAENPNLPPGALLGTFLNSPDGQRVFANKNVNLTNFFGEAQKLFAQPEPFMLGEGQRAFRDDGTGAKEIARGAAKKQTISTPIIGGSQEAIDMGLSALAPGKRYEVLEELDPETGNRTRTGLQSLEPMGDTVTPVWLDRNFKQRDKLAEDQLKMTRAFTTATELLGQLDKNPGQTGIGATDWLAETVSGIDAQVNAALDLVGDPKQRREIANELNPAYAPIWQKLKLAGQESAVIRGNVLSLGLAIAGIEALGEGRDLSDKDVDRVMRWMGANGLLTDQEAMKKAIANRLQVSGKSFDEKLRVSNEQFKNSPAGAKVDPLPDTKSLLRGKVDPRLLWDEIPTDGSKAPGKQGAADFSKMTPQELQAVDVDAMTDPAEIQAYIDATAKGPEKAGVKPAKMAGAPAQFDGNMAGETEDKETQAARQGAGKFSPRGFGSVAARQGQATGSSGERGWPADPGPVAATGQELREVMKAKKGVQQQIEAMKAYPEIQAQLRGTLATLQAEEDNIRGGIRSNRRGPQVASGGQRGRAKRNRKQ